jgi:hypothetical protein
MGTCHRSKSIIVPSSLPPKSNTLDEDVLTLQSTSPKMYTPSNFRPSEIVMFYHPELLCWIQSVVLRADSKNTLIYPITGYEKIRRSQYSYSVSKKITYNEPIITIDGRMICITRIKASLPNTYCYDCDKSLDLSYNQIPRMSKYDTWISNAKHRINSHSYFIKTFRFLSIKFKLNEWVDLQIGNFGITGWTPGIIYEVDEMCYRIAVETPEKGIIGIYIATKYINDKIIGQYKSYSYDGITPKPHQMVMYNGEFSHIVDVTPNELFSYNIELYKKENKIIDSSEIREISLENTMNFLKSNRPVLIFYYDI